MAMVNAAEHSLFLARWAAQAATVLTPHYALVTGVNTKLVKRRMQKLRGAQPVDDFPLVAEEEYAFVLQTPSKAKAKQTKKAAVATPPKALTRRDASKEAKQFLEMPALLNTLEAKRKLEKARSKRQLTRGVTPRQNGTGIIRRQM